MLLSLLLLLLCVNIWLFINVDKHIVDTNYDKKISHEKDLFY